MAIMISAGLGLLVSLSTFLVIGATSSLTYNVVGHLKTVIILTGGCVFFGDSMPLKKFLGVCVAFVGIIWYTHLKMVSAKPDASEPLKPLLPMVKSNGLDEGMSPRSAFLSVGLSARKGASMLSNGKVPSN